MAYVTQRVVRLVRPRLFPGRCWAGLLLCIGMVSGCTGFQQVVPAPLVFEEQSAEILKIVPLGTPKERAVRQLNEAGISGEFSSSPSIYYCDLWERESGNRWHLNVALLFNEKGELYKTKPAQADVTWETAKEAAATQKGPSESLY